LPEVDRRYPLAAATALAALAFAIPDDPQLRARLEVCEHLLEPETAELRLDAMRVRCLRDRDKAGECQACLTLAWLAAQHGDQEGAERHYRRVRSLMPTHPEALDFFERAYRESGDWKRLQVALVQRQSAAEGRELVHVTAELARINEGPLAAPDRATEAWERVLSLQPDHQEAAAALARLYEAQGRWAGLRDVLEATARMAQARVAIESAARQRAISAWERMGILHETPGQLPSRYAALQAWQGLVAYPSGCAGAHSRCLAGYWQSSHLGRRADTGRGGRGVAR
jgi:tetratricopeptide (TPR) repeat protein